MLEWEPMAPREDEAWKRYRDREDEQEDDNLETPGKHGVPPKAGTLGHISSGKLDELINRAEPMIEQISNLYNMFASGAERSPPTERRKQLEQTMMTLQAVGKPTPAIQFRCHTLLSQFQTQRDRWDRLMKDIESGKHKRVTGPKAR